MKSSLLTTFLLEEGLHHNGRVRKYNASQPRGEDGRWIGDDDGNDDAPPEHSWIAHPSVGVKLFPASQPHATALPASASSVRNPYDEAPKGQYSLPAGARKYVEVIHYQGAQASHSQLNALSSAIRAKHGPGLRVKHFFP